MTDNTRAAFLAGTLDPAWFTARYVHIYDATRQAWLAFTLWSATSSNHDGITGVTMRVGPGEPQVERWKSFRNRGRDPQRL